jgi:hypothetical protein
MSMAARHSTEDSAKCTPWQPRNGVGAIVRQDANSAYFVLEDSASFHHELNVFQLFDVL